METLPHAQIDFSTSLRDTCPDRSVLWMAAHLFHHWIPVFRTELIYLLCLCQHQTEVSTHWSSIIPRCSFYCYIPSNLTLLNFKRNLTFDLSMYLLFGMITIRVIIRQCWSVKLDLFGVPFGVVSRRHRSSMAYLAWLLKVNLNHHWQNNYPLLWIIHIS